MRARANYERVSDHHMREEELLARVTGSGLFRLSGQGRKTYTFLKEFQEQPV